MILFILQNAYRSAKYQFRNEDEWHEDLFRSHTGRRLKEMVPDGVQFCVVNSTDKIGDSADSLYFADPFHIECMLNGIKPDLVVACGKIAQAGCRELGIDFISAPHPAWRALSKKDTERIRNEIKMSCM